MKYIALQQLKTAEGTFAPGDLIPQAASWDRCWFATGHVAAYPDDMVEDVRARMGSGTLQMHGQEFGQQHLGMSLSPAAQAPVVSDSSKVEAQPAPTAKVGADVAPAPSPLLGDVPPGKAAIVADAGAPPTVSTGMAAESLGEAQDAAQDDAAQDSNKPTDAARPRRGRRGRS